MAFLRLVGFTRSAAAHFMVMSSAPMYTRPAMAPMMMAEPGNTLPQPAVMPTRPPRMPPHLDMDPIKKSMEAQVLDI